MSNNMILILDFSGSQSQSIARKVRGERVYCEVVPYTVSIDVVREKNPRGIMMIGNPRDISDDTPGGCAQAVYQLGVPVLAIGSAALLLARVRVSLFSETENAYCCWNRRLISAFTVSSYANPPYFT